jgi:tetratricopeptide (TPR) repeat protein
MRGEMAKAEDLFLELMQHCVENGFPFWQAQASCGLGWIQVNRGKPMDGIKQMLDGIGRYQATGSAPFDHMYRRLSETYRFLGDLDNSMRQLNEGLDLTRKNAGGTEQSELYRCQAENFVLLGEYAQAEKCLADAIAIAKAQRAKSFELRSTVTLGRLLVRQFRREEARAILTDVYNWFTEGFETADLKDARTLLDELSA